MVRPILILLMLMAMAHGAQACPRFGLETAYLSEFFCREFDALAGQPAPAPSDEPVTRTIEPHQGDGPGPLPGLGPDWMALPTVSEAWRVDPAATLQLIERIRAAGGRPMN